MAKSSLASSMLTTPAATPPASGATPPALPPAVTGKARTPRKVKIDPATGLPIVRDPAAIRAKHARKWAEANGVGPALGVITSEAVRDLIGGQAAAVAMVDRRVAMFQRMIDKVVARGAAAKTALESHLPSLRAVCAALSGVGAKEIAALESVANAAKAKAAAESEAPAL